MGGGGSGHRPPPLGLALPSMMAGGLPLPLPLLPLGSSVAGAAAGGSITPSSAAFDATSSWALREAISRSWSETRFWSRSNSALQIRASFSLRHWV